MLDNVGSHLGEPLSLREVQLASLEILKKVDEICQQEKLTYWLMYGTLLGAIRHRGFIPWDDDIDITMPRKDYDKLVKHFKTHEEEMRPLKLLCGMEDSSVPFLITRISDTRYKMVGEYGDALADLGVFIDVYPLDGVGSTVEEADEVDKAAKKTLLLYGRANETISHLAYRHKDTSLPKYLAKKVYRALSLKSEEEYVKCLSLLAARNEYETSDYVSCVIWDPLYRSKAWFSTTLRVPFESIEVSIPAGYDDILKRSYGDYMQLPPEEERVGHHRYVIYKK